MPRDTNPSGLHPLARDPILALTADIVHAGIPLHLYEAMRSPERQAELYARGRGTGERGKTVTRARAWESFHCHGFAADFVFRVGDKWTWNEPERGMWQKFQAFAVARGLRTLSFEKPHVEYAGIHLAQLQAGAYPPGDHGWTWAIEAAIERWGPSSREVGGILHPGAPPSPSVSERPESEP